MKRIFLISSLAVLLAGSGCVGANALKSLKALKDDHALVRLSMVTPWGQQQVVRANPGPGQSVTVNVDGSITMNGGGTNDLKIQSITFGR